MAIDQFCPRRGAILKSRVLTDDCVRTLGARLEHAASRSETHPPCLAAPLYFPPAECSQEAALFEFCGEYEQEDGRKRKRLPVPFDPWRLRQAKLFRRFESTF